MRSKFYLFVMMLVLVAGCRTEDPSLIVPETSIPPTTIATTQAFTEHPLADLEGECANLMWPVIAGAEWTYLSSRGETITLVAGPEMAGVELSTESGVSSLNCLETAISGILPAPFAGYPDYFTGFTVYDPLGDFLPPVGTLSPYGSARSWSMEAKAGGQITLPMAGAEATYSITDGKIVIMSMTAPVEIITTALGEFRALPVSQEIFLDLAIAGADGSVSRVLVTLNSTLYFTEGVGIVRMVFSGGTFSMSDSTLVADESVSYDLQNVDFP